jgi:DNA-binding protein Fis
MNRIKPDVSTEEDRDPETRPCLLDAKIGDSLDLLVDYLVENRVIGIHPLIMGEIEKRLIIKVLERSRGNKLQAAKLLGMSRNTFHRKIQKLGALDECLCTCESREDGSH